MILRKSSIGQKYTVNHNRGGIITSVCEVVFNSSATAPWRKYSKGGYAIQEYKFDWTVPHTRALH